ncbi:hypothetical protein [Caulobacter hibisci]|uniref:Uncharacterized protein n=1 Tax=Caulobacter hibisci TaxID=2035993 RepID=A0ABS0T4T2_9CAUL|nr:hypothetical protein [Caulobacter hibisci]MBI1685903.1 hypothetical protein [Caulobacter hibisci]
MLEALLALSLLLQPGAGELTPGWGQQRPAMPVLPGVTGKSAAATLAPPDCQRWTPKRHPLSVIGVCGAQETTITRANASRLSRHWSGLSAEGPTLQVTKGATAPGGEVFRIQVRQGYGGVLTSDLNGKTWGGGGRRFLPAGTPVYAVADFNHPNFPGAPLFLWCGPIAAGKSATTPDRALCFVDHTGRRTPPGLIASMNMVMMSGDGASPYAPATIQFAYSPPVSPADARPTNQSYPFAMTLTVRWKPEGPRGARFEALLDDGTSGPQVLRDWVDPSAADFDHEMLLGGGHIRYQRIGDTLMAAMIEPVETDGLVFFTADRGSLR